MDKQPKNTGNPALSLEVYFPEFNIRLHVIEPRILPTEGMLFRMNWEEYLDTECDLGNEQTARFLEKYANKNGCYKVHVTGIVYGYEPYVKCYADYYCIELYKEDSYDVRYGYSPLTQKICAN